MDNKVENHDISFCKKKKKKKEFFYFSEENNIFLFLL